MEIYYLNNRGEKLYLDREPYYLLDSSDIVDYEWDYKTNESTSRVYNFIRGVKNKKLDIAIISDSKDVHGENIDRIVKHFEYDIDYAVPGKLYINNYYIPCYVHKSSKEARYINGKRVIVHFEIVKSGGWIKETTVPFRWQEQQVDQSGKTYPYNYPYNYGIGTGFNSEVEVDSISDMDFIITIYGYAHNPEISIGANTYKIEHEVSPSEILVINSKDKTVYLINRSTGIVKSMFRYRSKDYWIFEKIPSGNHLVYWNGAYNFDLQLLEERSEPKWT